MAAKFGTGFLHGTLVMAVLLAGLSLAVPQPDRLLPAEPVPEPVAEPEVAPEPAAPVIAELPPQAEPLAAEVDLPVGSEFARGTEVAPELPAPSAPPVATMTDAPAVMAPAGEPLPAPATDAPRPEFGDSAPVLSAQAEQQNDVVAPEVLPGAAPQTPTPEAPLAPEGDRMLAALPNPDLPPSGDAPAVEDISIVEETAPDLTTPAIDLAVVPAEPAQIAPPEPATSDAPETPDQTTRSASAAPADLPGIDLSLPPTLSQIPGL